MNEPPNRAAFEQQNTSEMRFKVLRYARQRAAMVRRAGRWVDSLYADDLAHDAVVDIWSGDVAWDPARCPLLHQVRSVIRWRTRDDARWIQRRAHESMDVSGPVAISAAASHRLAACEQDRPIMLADLAVIVVSELRKLARGDDRVGAILDAWGEGLSERDEVMRWTGLSSVEYRNARARLTYLIQDLPESLRDIVTTVLRSAQ